jgi:hypothetical protein
MLTALGATVRLVLGPGHAYLELEVTDWTGDVAAQMLDAVHQRCAGWGLQPLQFPNARAVVANGWRRRGEANFESNHAMARSWVVGQANLRFAEDADGRRWMRLDTCTTRVPGDISGLIKMGCVMPSGAHVSGTTLVMATRDGPQAVTI